MIRDQETLNILLDTVRRFVRERCVPAEAAVAEADRIPEDVVAEMRRMGLFGFAIPQEHGGMGLTLEEEVLVNFELSRCSPVFRSIAGTNNGIGSMGIVIDGTEAQKRKYLPRLASGEIIGSFALTEPGSGSDAGALTTSARREGDCYVLNGTKRFITNAPEAGIFTVMARTDPSTRDASGVSAFIVEAGTPGLKLGSIDRNRINGYQNEEFTHAAVAALIAGGQADAGFAVEAAASQFRLGFVALATERYYLACRHEELGQPALASLIATLQGPQFSELIGSLAGYSAPKAGEVCTVTEALKACLPFAASLEAIRTAAPQLTPAEVFDAVCHIDPIAATVRGWGGGEQRLANVEALRALILVYQEEQRHERQAATLESYHQALTGPQQATVVQRRLKKGPLNGTSCAFGFWTPVALVNASDVLRISLPRKDPRNSGLQTAVLRQATAGRNRRKTRPCSGASVCTDGRSILPRCHAAGGGSMPALRARRVASPRFRRTSVSSPARSSAPCACLASAD